MNEAILQEPRPLDAISDVPQEYIPSRVSLLKDYEIRIQFMSRGCVVYVGCKSIPFESVELAMTHLNKYVNYPYETRKEWENVLD